MLYRLTIPQSRYINASTTQRHLQLCKDKGEEPKTIEVDGKDGKAVAHWLGSPDAEHVVLYAHGGGYTQPASPGHLEYFYKLVQDMNAQPRPSSFAVVVLAYTLAPEARYPHQLREAAIMLSHLINDASKSPSKILLSGDSAGGGLVFSLLSHLLHPHPHVPEVKLSAPLAGAFLYSSWVSFRTDHDSFTRNAHIDVLVPNVLRRWSAMYMSKSNDDPETDPGPISGDSYSEPASNDPAWWHGMHRVVSNVLVWAGGDEVLVDGMRDFDRDFRKGWETGGGDAENVLFVEIPRGAHIGPILENMISKRKANDQMMIEEWLKARLDS